MSELESRTPSRQFEATNHVVCYFTCLAELRIKEVPRLLYSETCITEAANKMRRAAIICLVGSMNVAIMTT